MKYFFCTAFTFLLFGAKAQQLTPVDTQSKIAFVIKNMGLNVDGTLTGLTGTIYFDAQKTNTAQFDVTVTVNTINTGNTKRDTHLKAADFFDAEKYPTIRIKSTAITQKGNDYFFTGTLTIKNISKKVSFGFSVKPATNGYLFEGGFTINRRDYGVGSNSLTMGDDVKIIITAFAKK